MVFNGSSIHNAVCNNVFEIFKKEQKFQRQFHSYTQMSVLLLCYKSNPDITPGIHFKDLLTDKYLSTLAVTHYFFEHKNNFRSAERARLIVTHYFFEHKQQLSKCRTFSCHQKSIFLNFSVVTDYFLEYENNLHYFQKLSDV